MMGRALLLGSLTSLLASAALQAQRAPLPPATGPLACSADPKDSAVAARPVRGAESSVALRLNLPAFRLDVSDSGRIVATFRVAVGMAKYRTPTGRFVVAGVVWNPWWIPPKSPWARRDTVTPPGPRNPMGRVKILLRGPYFIHGTPDSASIGRAASHGCIRMRQADAVTLAQAVLRAAGSPIAPEAVDTLLATPDETREIAVRDSVRVELVYELAEVQGDTLVLWGDVYRRAPPVRPTVARALLDAGLDTADFDLRRLPARWNRTTVRRIPLARLRRDVAHSARGGRATSTATDEPRSSLSATLPTTSRDRPRPCDVMATTSAAAREARSSTVVATASATATSRSTLATPASCSRAATRSR